MKEKITLLLMKIIQKINLMNKIVVDNQFVKDKINKKYLKKIAEYK